MTETSLDQLGPVDYVVVEFPAGASNFTGEMAAEEAQLADLLAEEDVEHLAASTDPAAGSLARR